MKKLFLIGLMMLAGSSWAEWVMYEKSDTSTYYYDPVTIRKDGNMRRVWELTDLRKRGRSGEMSRRIRMEYDCKEERYRFLFISGHSEPMAKGEILITEGEGNVWDAIAPGTISETIFNIVCTK